ncbi:hypothetical protein ACN6KF_003012 [Labrys sp. La1]|uniref:hypothetical protein n=1 Tax=Labrys sp. La1 TaxID=3404917 RepID=UPI003EBC71E4
MSKTETGGAIAALEHQITNNMSGGETNNNEPFEDTRRKIADRKTMAKQLVACSSSIRFHKDNGHTALVGPDLSTGRSRLTYFDDKGPICHVEYNTLTDAIEAALSENYRPGYYTVDSAIRARGGTNAE